MSTAASDAAARRERAFEDSAWGERFHLFQPRNLCFWIYVVAVGVSTHALINQFAAPAGFVTEAVVVAVGINGALGLVWWLWFRHLDRWEHQPLQLLVAAFVWGAVPATFGIAVGANGAMMSLWSKWFGQEWAGAWEAALTAPFVEESAKFSGFLLLMALAPRLIRTVNDGLIVGAFIGLGFQIAEDVSYGVSGAFENFATDPVGGAVGTAGLRVVTGFVSHPLYTALCCAGLVYLIGTKTQERRVVRGVLLLASGMLTHMIWDSVIAFANSGAATVGVLFCSATFGLTVLAIAFRLARPVEHAFARDILAPEVESGLLSDDEVSAVLDRKQRKVFVHAGRSHHARRARKHLVAAAYELMQDLATAKGAESADVVMSRSEVERFRIDA